MLEELQGERYYHGTIASRLPSIAKHGLLSRERLEDMGIDITHPYYTKSGSVYFTTKKSTYQMWSNEAKYNIGIHNDRPVTLVIEFSPEDLEDVIDDRNFGNGYNNFEYRQTNVPPEKIRVLTSRRVLIPIREYVSHNYHNAHTKRS